MTEQLQVHPPELATHAGTVRAIAGEVAGAGAAGRAVRAGPESYGRLCSMFPAALGALQDVVISAIDAAADTLHTGGAGLSSGADGYRAADQRRADAFRGIRGER
ncbi:MAG TPA: type VII secretion target [Actinoplanes sp.]|nr:type VII secretion target [Actinoplanes sp.]